MLAWLAAPAAAVLVLGSGGQPEAPGVRPLSETRDPRADAALERAERLLAEAARLPARAAERGGVEDFAAAFSDRADFEDAEAAFQQVIQASGASARAWSGQGETRLRRGDYPGAARAFARAVKLAPADPAALAGARRAEERLRLVRAVTPQLLAGHNVLQVQAFPAKPEASLWMVLSATNSREGAWFGEIAAPRLTLFREAAGGLARCWQSGSLEDPRYGESIFRGVQLYVWDLTGDGTPEVGAERRSHAASCEPTHLAVFRWNGSGLTKVFGVAGSFPIWIEDLNGDGRYEIGTCYEIGWEMAHVEQPLWTDVYAWQGEGYALANREFPQLFRHWPATLRPLLREHPHDPELLERLGMAYAILGRRPRSLGR